MSSPIAKFFDDATLEPLDAVSAVDGDLILFGAGPVPRPSATSWCASPARGARPGPGRQSLEAPLWVVDFPMFEYDAEEQRYYALHHPFTAPIDDIADLKANAKNAESRLRPGAETATRSKAGSIPYPSPGHAERGIRPARHWRRKRAKFGFCWTL